VVSTKWMGFMGSNGSDKGKGGSTFKVQCAG
jgi:hypothetical protein